MSSPEDKQRRRDKMNRDRDVQNYGRDKARREAENRKRHRKAA